VSHKVAYFQLLLLPVVS